MFNDQDPIEGQRQQENDKGTDGSFPYSDYYSGGYNTTERPIYVDSGSRRKKRPGAVVFVCVIMVLTAAICTFLSSYELSVQRSDDGIDFAIRQKGTSTLMPEVMIPAETEPLPSAAINAESPETGPVPSAPTGSGTTLFVTTLEENAETLSLKEIYALVSPSVVSVYSSYYESSAGSSGTGIIMSADGYIITNNHIITGGNMITVETADGEAYTAAVVGSDEISDLAVIKIDGAGLTAAQFGSSENLAVGDAVSAIGNPLGSELRGTFTDGIISAINRDITIDGRKMTLIQTNAALNAGNSGGPLINSYGQVIGINTMKLTSSALTLSASTIEGLGFAIPISLAKPIIDELIEKGYVAGRPSIGFTGKDLPASTAAYYRLPQGVYVTGVDERSDAYAQGVQTEDIITAVNDEPVTTMNEVKAIKNTFSAGEVIKLTIYRGGEFIDLHITLMDQEELD